MEHLRTFDGKTLRAAEKADLDLLTPPVAPDALSDNAAQELAKWIKEKLAERVGAVRVSKRLVSSPAVVLESDRTMTSSMRRILKNMNRDEAKNEGIQDLEINPRHPVIVRLDKIRQTNQELAVKVVEQINDNARVAAGLLDDPRPMLKRLNELLEQVLK